MAERRRFEGWAASAAVAARPDLDPNTCASLSTHPQVQLLLAANPRTPSAHVAGLRDFDDLFVRRLASIHPALPLDERLAAARDVNAPAWVVRRLAADRALPPDARAQLEERLATGEAHGDPSFDPIECVGSPGVSGETEEAAYRRFAGSQGIESSLWRSRATIATDMGLVDPARLVALAEDGREEVRAAVARVGHRDTLKQLRSDPSAAVRAEVEATLADLPRIPLRRRLAPVLMVLAALAVLPLGIVLFIAAGKGMNGADELRNPEVVDIGEWRPAISNDIPASGFICRAGGTMVWFDVSDRLIRVYVQVTTPKVATVVLRSPDPGEAETSTVSITPGDTMSFRQPIGESGVLSIAIGDNADKPIQYRMGSDAPSVGDADGDC